MLFTPDQPQQVKPTPGFIPELIGGGIDRIANAGTGLNRVVNSKWIPGQKNTIGQVASGMGQEFNKYNIFAHLGDVPIHQFKYAENISSKIKNPVGRAVTQFGLGIPENIMNIPSDFQRGAAQTATDVGTGKVLQPRIAASDTASLLLPVITAQTLGIGRSAVKQLGQQTLKQAVVKGGLTGLKYGSGFGFLGGLQSGRNITNPLDYATSVAKNTATSGVIGGLTGAAIAGGGHLLSSAFKPVLSPEASALDASVNYIKSDATKQLERIRTGGGLNETADATIPKDIAKIIANIDTSKAKTPMEAGITIFSQLPESVQANPNVQMTFKNMTLTAQNQVYPAFLQKALDTQAKVQKGGVDFNAEIGGKEVPSSRPPHQIALEKAWDAKNYPEAQKIISAMPEGDPYKMAMQSLQDIKMKSIISSEPPTGVLPKAMGQGEEAAMIGQQPGQPGIPSVAPPTTPPGTPPASFAAPAERQRGLLETTQNANTLSQPTKEAVAAIEPQTYTQQANAPLIEKVTAQIKADPDAMKARVLSNEAPSAEKGLLATQLAKYYDQQRNHAAATEVIEAYDRQAREAGRFIQPAALFEDRSPDGMVKFGEKAVTDANKNLDMVTKGWRKLVGKEATVLTTEDKTAIRGFMQQATEATDETAKKAFTQQALDVISEKVPIGASDYFDAYRYSNMLSGPKSQERNIGSNLFQTFVTRPYEIGTEAGVDWLKSTLTGKPREAYFKDVPTYYKTVLNSFPSAWIAAKESFKNREMLQEPTLQGLQTQKLPGFLTAIPSAMNAEDKYFSTMISAGEYARLMSHGGITEEVAQSQANKLAQQYLYRGGFESKNTNNALFVRALDGLGESTNYTRKVPVLGEAFGWMVPFVKTPINYAKANIERTPLGLLGGKLDTPQLAKAAAGTALMGAGALAALQNKTTWSAPTDQNAKESFYATGRKPYSVLIGGTWVPMWYLGPYALAFAMPTAFRHYWQEDRGALANDFATKATAAVLSTTNFLASQTPLQGVAGFYRLLDGDVDFTLPNLAAATLSQAIPAEGFIAYMNKFIDPVFRKSQGFFQTLEKDFPGLSQNLTPYTKPNGELSKRDLINQFISYDVGKSDIRFEGGLQNRERQLQFNQHVSNFGKTIDQEVERTLPALEQKMYNRLQSNPQFQQLPIQQREKTLQKLRSQLKGEVKKQVLLKHIKELDAIIRGSPTRNIEEKQQYLQTLRQQGLLTDDVVRALINQ